MIHSFSTLTQFSRGSARVVCLLAVVSGALLADASYVSVGQYGTNSGCSKTDFPGVSLSCSSTSPHGEFSGSAQESAGSGSLHASATATYNGMPDPSYFTAYGGGSQADAVISDTLFLSGAPSSGFLRFSLSLDGTLGLTQDTPGYYDSFVEAILYAGVGNSSTQVAPLQFCYAPDGGLCSASASSTPGAVSGTAIVDLPYSGSTPQISFVLVAAAECYAGGSAPQPGNCNASADFSNTGTVNGIGILNSNNQFVPGATFTSASGYTYPNLVSAPEPNALSVFLAFSLLTAILPLRQRKTRTDRLQTHS